MRVSLSWLRDWLSGAAPLEPQDVASRLTMSGLEIESIEPAAPPLHGVVVGEVLECARHPNADALSLCRVAAGGEPVPVVCGAPNVRAGMKAPFAQLGALLPGGLEIRKAKLRGVESHGMLCSARELGLGDEAGGLMELPASLPTGAPVTAALGLDDTILDVAVAANRGDCMSVLGIARELTAITGRTLVPPPMAAVPAGTPDTFPVELTPGAGCARFAARVIRGLRADAVAPLWLRERLRRAGLRSLGAAVDVTNYVMLELGQPMHAYDLHELDRAIVVRRARPGETLRLLDGRDVELGPDVMVIADRSRALALAGIMGGEHTGIGPRTTDVLLEVAFFRPEAVIGRGRRYGLVTDASQRFERGVDPTLQERAIERATELLLECAGGSAGPTIVSELAAELPVRTPIRFRPGRARRVIGAAIDDGAMAQILRGLGLAFEASGEEWAVLPPPWRFDLGIEEDLVEEIARVHGLDRIPETDGLGALVLPALPEARVSADEAIDVLVQRGYHEAISYSFVDPATQAAVFPDAASLALANPISADLSVMRVSLWPGLLRALGENQRRQQSRLRLVESGRRFVVQDDGLAEIATVAGLAAGLAEPEQWGTRARPVDFFDVRADLEALFAATGAAQEFAFEAATHPALHPGQCSRIVRNGEAVGWLGRLHPQLERKLELTYSPVLFELDADPALAGRLPQFREISRFPGVRRDLAIVVPEGVRLGALCEQVRASAGELLTELVVFDVYRGAGIEAGSKSIAIGLNLQDVSRTLTDDVSDAVVARVVRDLEREFRATIRDK